MNGAEVAPYTEAETSRMALAFEAAWERLKDSGSVHAQPYQAERTRERIALKIIELVRQCPADVERLRDEAISQWGLLPKGLKLGPDAEAHATAP